MPEKTALPPRLQYLPDTYKEISKYLTLVFYYYLEEVNLCDWFFYFAHQGDHFTILTGLARSRLKTLCKWMEANVSDVLLTCWANNSLHQQFYMALLVPTVKLTMHSISIRQENDPCSPRFLSTQTCKGVQRSKLLNWKEYLLFCET